MSVYKKSQSIMYIGDKENSNTDSALVSTKRSLIFNELNKELVPEVLYDRRGTAGLPGRLYLYPRYVGATRYHELLPV